MSFPIYSHAAYRRRKKRLRLFSVLFTAVLIVTACAAPALMKDESSLPASVSSDDVSVSEEDSLSSSEPVPEQSSEPTTEISVEPSSEVSSEQASGSSQSVSITGPGTMPFSSQEPSYQIISGPSIVSSEESSEITSSEEGEDPAVYVTEYDYTQPVPEGDPVDDDHFGSAVFVGNSRTQGFVLYSGITNVTAYTDRGLNVKSAASKEIVSVGGKKVTVLDALRQNKTCESVYLMFGINEVGWPQEHVFIEKYTALINAIQENNPSAKIYVQSILPVSKEKSDSDKYINNERIREFNTMIREMALQEQVYYIDLYAAMADDSGNLPDDAASDGIHLKKSYCEKWLDYLRTHVVYHDPAEEENQNEE